MALARPWLTDTARDRKSRRVIISSASKQACDFLTCLRIVSCLSDRGVCPDLVCGALATQVCLGVVLELLGKSNVLKFRLKLRVSVRKSCRQRLLPLRISCGQPSMQYLDV